VQLAIARGVALAAAVMQSRQQRPEPIKILQPDDIALANVLSFVLASLAFLRRHAGKMAH
jgi:hypothetical protein